MIGELDDSRIGKEIDDWMIGRLDDWGRDRGRRTEDGDQKSEVRGQRSVVREGRMDGHESSNQRIIESSSLGLGERDR